MEKAWELEEAQARLAETVSVTREELKKQVVAKAEENKRLRLSNLEGKVL